MDLIDQMRAAMQARPEEGQQTVCQSRAEQSLRDWQGMEEKAKAFMAPKQYCKEVD